MPFDHRGKDGQYRAQRTPQHAECNDERQELAQCHGPRHDRGAANDENHYAERCHDGLLNRVIGNVEPGHRLAGDTHQLK